MSGAGVGAVVTQSQFLELEQGEESVPGSVGGTGGGEWLGMER